jgi:hypothetical protein
MKSLSKRLRTLIFVAAFSIAGCQDHQPPAAVAKSTHTPELDVVASYFGEDYKPHVNGNTPLVINDTFSIQMLNMSSESHEEFTKSPGIITISRVGFNRQGDMAMIYVGSQSHWLAWGRTHPDSLQERRQVDRSANHYRSTVGVMISNWTLVGSDSPRGGRPAHDV